MGKPVQVQLLSLALAYYERSYGDLPRVLFLWCNAIRMQSVCRDFGAIAVKWQCNADAMPRRGSGLSSASTPQCARARTNSRTPANKNGPTADTRRGSNTPCRPRVLRLVLQLFFLKRGSWRSFSVKMGTRMGCCWGHVSPRLFTPDQRPRILRHWEKSMASER